MGRPTKFTEAVAAAICSRIADGESLREICEGNEMPGRRTVLDWLDDERLEAFRAKYERARVAQGDAMDDKILATADKSTPESAAADRVKIDAYKWRAAKLNPKRYGERSQVDVGVTESLRSLIASSLKPA